jgi:hypothetical protein
MILGLHWYQQGREKLAWWHVMAQNVEDSSAGNFELFLWEFNLENSKYVLKSYCMTDPLGFWTDCLKFSTKSSVTCIMLISIIYIYICCKYFVCIYELVVWALWEQVHSLSILDGRNRATSCFDRFTSVIKLRFLFGPMLSIFLIHVTLILRFTCWNLFVLTLLNRVQFFVIYVLLFLALNLFGYRHSITLTATN